MAYLGQISYGTYLWHWPVVVLLQQFWGRSLGLTAVVAVLSTAFAAASYHLVERPIRQHRVRAQWRFPAIATGLAASALAAFVVVPLLQGSQIKPVLVAAPDAPQVNADNVTGPTPEIDYAKFSDTRGGPERSCTATEMAECRVHTGEDGPTIWIMGDSQARELEPAVTALARERGVNVWISAIDGCPWPAGIVRVAAPESRQRSCADLKADLPSMFAKASVDVVLLVQQDRQGEPFAEQLGTDVGGQPVADENVPRLYRTRVGRTLNRFQQLGVRTLLMEGAWLPPDDSDPLTCLAARWEIQECAIPAPDRASALDRAYRKEARTRKDVFDVTISPLLCPARPVCDAVLDGIPVYRDSRHYSPPILADKREEIWQRIQKSGALTGLS